MRWSERRASKIEEQVSSHEVIIGALSEASPYPDVVQSLGNDGRLADAALDSLAFVEMLTSIEERVQVDLSPRIPELRKLDTLGQFASLLDEVRGLNGPAARG